MKVRERGTRRKTPDLAVKTSCLATGKVYCYRQGVLLQARSAPSSAKSSLSCLPCNHLHPTLRQLKMFCHLLCRLQHRIRRNSTLGSPEGLRGAGAGGAPVRCAHWVHYQQQIGRDGERGVVLRHFGVFAIPPLLKATCCPPPAPAHPERAFRDACTCVVGRSHFMAVPHLIGTSSKHIICCLAIV